MSQPSHANGAYSWTGTLKTTNIRQLYERCQRLRLTGRMQLRQGDQSLELVWIGGEPIETESDQGTRSLPLWNTGDFVVEQCIPDWKGQLTKGVELTGALKASLIQSIYKLCADNQLSADVELKRQSGEAAQVRFTLGKAEAATISGQTESALTALSKLSAWSDGTFRVALRPLFGDVQAAEAPVFSEKDRSDDQFDVTGSMDIARDGVNWPPKVREPTPVGQPVPMGPPMARALPGATAAGGGSAATPPPAASATSGSSSSGIASASSSGTKNNRLATTLVGSQAAAAGAMAAAAIPASALPTQPMSTMSRENAMKLARAEQPQQPSAASPQKAVSSTGRTLVVVSIVVIVLCVLAVVGLLVWKQLQPASTDASPAAAPAPEKAAPSAP